MACVGLLATACGGASTATDTASGDSPAAAPAQADPSSLAVNDDVRLTEVLGVVDGSVQTLRTAVDGDRPVLLWFWAPH